MVGKKSDWSEIWQLGLADNGGCSSAVTQRPVSLVLLVVSEAR